MAAETDSKSSVLLGKSQEELDREDQLLSALSNLAYSVKETPDSGYDPSRKRTSRFWFKLETTDQFVVKRKKSLAPKAVEHIDAEITDRLKTYEKELSPVLKDKINQVREFFLTEIAPLTLATSGGAIQSRAVAERMLDTEVDSAIFARFENMANRAATIKLGLFVLDYFGLPHSHFNELLGGGQVKEKSSELSQILEAIQNSSRDVKKLPSEISAILKQDVKK